MSQTLAIDMQRPLAAGENIFLIGPGGVGKSTLGAALATLAGWPLIDLDLEFCSRIETIAHYIATHGYQAYRAANLNLAAGLVATLRQPSVFVTSSGFLAASPDSNDYRTANALLQTGYSISLLPSLDLAQATDIVVARQLTRGFGFERDSEISKFHARFATYRDRGDMQIVASEISQKTARAAMDALGLANVANRLTDNGEH